MRNAVSIAFIILLAVTTPLLLLMTSLQRNVVTANFLKRELVRANVYGLLTSQIDSRIANLTVSPEYPITKEELLTIAHAVVAETWLQQNVESLLDSFFLWLKAPQNAELVLPIDLRQPRDELVRRTDTLLAEKLPLLKPCTKKSSEGLCHFAGMSVAQVKTELAHMGIDIASFQTLLPDTVNLAKPDLSAIFGPQSNESPDSLTKQIEQMMVQLTRVKEVYRQATRYIFFAWLSLGILAASYIALNATHGRRRLVRWTGILLFSISVAPLGMTIAARVLVEQRLLPALRAANAIPTEVVPFISQFILDLQHALFFAFLLVGGVLLGAGLAAMIESHFLRNTRLVKKVLLKAKTG